MAIRTIKQVTFEEIHYPELLAKINAVTPYIRKSAHYLVHNILINALNEQIASYGIYISITPTRIKGRSIAKKVKQLTFQDKKYPELLAKLNAVAPYARRCVHNLAHVILEEKLDELISEYGISIDFQPQPAVG